VISHSSRARDLVTIAEVDSRSWDWKAQLAWYGISSRPSWQGLSVSIALLSNTGFYC